MFRGFKSIDSIFKEASIEINKEVASALKELGRLQENIWKGTAYSRAASNIEKLTVPITEFDDFTEISGVGNDISLEIQEYLNTKSIDKLESFREEEKGKEKFTKEHALKLTKEFFQEAVSLGLQFTITGSIRRKVERVKDIDAIILMEQFDKWSDLVEGFEGDILRKGVQEIDFTINGIDVNLRAVFRSEYGAGVLYFSGPKSFMVFMRQEAKKKGLKLNRHGLFDKEGNQIAVIEKDIFNKIGIPWVEPEER